MSDGPTRFQWHQQAQDTDPIRALVAQAVRNLFAAVPRPSGPTQRSEPERQMQRFDPTQAYTSGPSKPSRQDANPRTARSSDSPRSATNSGGLNPNIGRWVMGSLGEQQNRKINAGAMAGAGIGASAGRVGAPAPAGPSPIDQAIEEILAGMGGGYTALPMPDRNAMLAPYDQAEASARKVYGEITPRIQNNYDVLDADLAASAADYEARMGAIAQRLNAEQAQTQARTGDAVAASEQALAAQGGGASSLVQELAAEAAAQQSAQAQVQGAADDILQQINALGTNASQSVQAQADSTEAASKTDAEMALAAVLNKIGLGRADAESQYAAQAADISFRNAQMEQEARQVALEEAIAAREQYDVEQQDIYAQAVDEGWNINAQRRMRDYPNSWAIVQQAISEGGKSKDPISFTNAQQALYDIVQDVGLGDASQVDDLEEWLRQYYGVSTKGVDQGVFRRLGGDESWLRRYLSGG